MYICVGILLILCILCFVTIFFKRRHIIFKIHHMDPCTKLNLLNSFAEPFGFHYDSQEDIISSNLNAWQPRFSHQKRIHFSQCQNFVFSKLFLFLTRSFTCTVDKILFLYFFLPSVFRHILHFRKASKHQYRNAIRKNELLYPCQQSISECTYTSPG